MTLYIKNLTIAAFPETYKDDIKKLDDFFNFLRLDYFEALIWSGGFKIKAIVAFIKLVSVHYNEGRIKVFEDAYTTFEAYISISLGTYKNKFTFPDITDNVLHLKDFYHPLLKEPVKNCFNPEANVTLLTGPNMSGKSTLLKALGICVYLANAGFPVPAAEAAIPKYDSIFVFINLNDDLQSGYSHFMTEVINLKQVVTTAKSSRCFAVFDELFRGTNIEDAFEISETTLKGLLNYKNSMFLVSSHLHQLVTIPQITAGQIACHYLDCSLKDNNPAFTYQLKEGWTDIKIGKVLFEKEGLNEILAAE
ncbi:MutS-related protein [Flavobacterium cyanobacteriorum]|nr:hypothetical protein [Flavobacterium cyanobacteriorum]